jgi:histidinol-phosphate aminotransferase
MSKFPLTPLVASLPATVPFVGPETQERQRGAPFAARLGANENGFGPAPSVCAAIAEAASGAWMYGDPEAHELRHAVADHLGITADAIMLGEGIDGLLGYLVRMVIGAGDAVVTSDGAYPTFNYHVTGFGGVLHKVPYRDDHEDPDALIAKAHEVGATLVYLSNPDNPMGSWLPVQRISDMIAALPDGCMLVLDEAYADFLPSDAVPALDTTDPRVVRMRTFSKAYGLAGMRVGYAIGHPDFINSFNAIRNHFGMGRVSQVAALAALADQAYLAETLDRVAVARERVAEIARTNGLVPLPSATNFVTIDCGRDGAYARAVLGGLIERGVFARMPFVAPGDRCIRISVGPEAEMDVFETALPQALAALS